MYAPLLLLAALSSSSLVVAFPRPGGSASSTPTSVTPASATPTLSSKPWNIIVQPSETTFTSGNARLIGDQIVVAGGPVLQYNITSGAQATTNLGDSVYGVYGASSNDIWAAGQSGFVGHFNGVAWSTVTLPFPIQLGTTFRQIHGTSSNNVWFVAGSGEDPPILTSLIVHWDGKTFTQYLKNKFGTATTVFARGSDVWVGFGDGLILHTSDNFASYRQVASRKVGDYSVHEFWGDASSSTIYVVASDGIKSISNIGCKETPFSTKSCQSVTYLGIPPDHGNTGYGVETVIGGLPTLPSGALYTAGSFAWGGIYASGGLYQDKTIPNTFVQQSTYTSLMLAKPDAQGRQFLYALANCGAIAARQLTRRRSRGTSKRLIRGRLGPAYSNVSGTDAGDRFVDADEAGASVMDEDSEDDDCALDDFNHDRDALARRRLSPIDELGPKLPGGDNEKRIRPKSSRSLWVKLRRFVLLPSTQSCNNAIVGLYLFSILLVLNGAVRGYILAWCADETPFGSAFISCVVAFSRVAMFVVTRMAISTKRRSRRQTDVVAANGSTSAYSYSTSPTAALALRVLITYSLISLFSSFWDIKVSIRRASLGFAFLDSVLSTSLVSLAGYVTYVGSLQTRVAGSLESADKTWRETSANVLSRISFSWLNPLIDLALERPLSTADLWDLAGDDRGAVIHARFADILRRSIRKEGYVIRALVRLVWKELAFEYAVSLTDHLFLFANPVLIHRILSAIQDPEKSQADLLSAVVGMLLASLARTACESQLYWINRRLDARIRAALVGCLYEKTLRRLQVPLPLPGSEGKEGGKNKKEKGSSGDGTVTNLMSADTDRILACFRQSHYALSVPVLILACFGLLIRTIGLPGAVAGISALSLAVPATKTVGKLIKQYKRELMGKSDERMSKLGELLKGIRTIKLLTWEPYFSDHITQSRRKELDALKSYLTSTVATQLIWRGSPLVASAATFLVRALFAGTAAGVDPASAFTVLTLYNNVLRYPLFVVPKLVVALMEARVSVGRIEQFLAEVEIERHRKKAGGSEGDFGVEEEVLLFDSEGLGGDVEMEGSEVEPGGTVLGFSGDASFDYGAGGGGMMAAGRDSKATGDGITTGPVLKGLNFEFQTGGAFTLVVGPTGSGKTSLLLALLGELRTLSGSAMSPLTKRMLTGPTPMAYVSQIPWLQNATVRENILFGTPFDANRYDAVIEACALKPDIDGLEYGDMTEIGERGVTLSGGQKQRICLARAVYSRAPFLLLDDVLSAIDAQTARHILHSCLQGSVTSLRTRVLVTNNLDLCLPAADCIVVLRSGGTVAVQGPVSEVLARAATDPRVREALEDAGVPLRGRNAGNSHQPAVLEVGSRTPPRPPSVLMSAKKGGESGVVPATPPAARREVRAAKEEAVATGRVAWSVYDVYIKAGGGLLPTAGLLSVIVLAYFLGFAHDYALKVWADGGGSTKAAVEVGGVEGSGLAATSSGGKYLALYVLAAFLALVSLQVRFLAQIYFSLRASSALHAKALARLLGCGLLLLEGTPSGRVINRFGKDMQSVDQEVVGSIGETLQQLVHGVAVVGMVAAASPVLIIGAIPIAVLYYPIARRFLAATRSLKRIEGITRSPVYSSFNEALAGVTTIRAFGREKLLLQGLLDRVDANHRAFLPLWAANRWLAFRVELVGSLVAFAAGASIAAGRGGQTGSPMMDAGWSGLCLNYASMFTDVLTV
ncbi:hypothetical protein HK101_010969 [Irineochytrium annulatum]|nr:hypothetical protein HK101_010969 [Irineochytrium annulatum]